MSELAVILPVLNCLEYTKGFLDTLEGKARFHLILINNGSSDGTEDYFNFLKSNFQTHIFNFNDNKGVSGAWNFGIYHAIHKLNCRYFLVCNNDSILHPQAIEILLKTIEAPNVVMATATDVSGRIPVALDILKEKICVESFLTECPDFSCFMLKKETIDKIGWFDEKFYPAYFEDNDYHYRINMAGLKAYKSNQALFFHFGSRTMQSSGYVKAVCNENFWKNNDYFIEKWGGPPGKETFKTPFNKK
jgi:GT2 family glycosyltransferase